MTGFLVRSQIHKKSELASLANSLIVFKCVRARSVQFCACKHGPGVVSNCGLTVGFVRSKSVQVLPISLPLGRVLGIGFTCNKSWSSRSFKFGSWLLLPAHCNIFLLCSDPPLRQQRISSDVKMFLVSANNSYGWWRAPHEGELECWRLIGH